MSALHVGSTRFYTLLEVEEGEEEAVEFFEDIPLNAEDQTLMNQKNLDFDIETDIDLASPEVINDTETGLNSVNPEKPLHAMTVNLRLDPQDVDYRLELNDDPRGLDTRLASSANSTEEGPRTLPWNSDL